MTMRTLARASAAGLLAAGMLAFAATPALAAADVDFGLEFKGTSIALGAGEKPATLTLTNHGKSTPDFVGVTFEAAHLDTTKVEVDLGGCEFENGQALCGLDEESIPGPGETVETDIPLRLKDGVEGPADLGKLSATVVVEGDTNSGNDTKTVDVKVTGSGGDLRVLAYDVTDADGEALNPGETSVAEAIVANHGDRATKGFAFEVTLPQHVTFAEEFEGCDYNAAKTKVTCSDDEWVLAPWNTDDTEDKEHSSLSVGLPVTVSKDAKGPVALKDGKWTFSALGLDDSATKRRAAVKQTAPEFAKPGCEDEAQVETDASDNSDTFAVLVAAPAGGGGGGEEPGLPVTGPVAAGVAGAGAAVLVVGVALFLVSRRRRVVLVTPGDGK